MARRPNTDARGQPFSKETVEMVWRKAIPVPGIDPHLKRHDACGAWIDRTQFGVHGENGVGWEIDHIRPVVDGGNDDLGNLQPLQWENNRKKGDNYPYWSCSTEAESG